MCKELERSCNYTAQGNNPNRAGEHLEQDGLVGAAWSLCNAVSCSSAPTKSPPGAHRAPSDISPDYCSPWFSQPRSNIIGIAGNSILSISLLLWQGWGKAENNFLCEIRPVVYGLLYSGIVSWLAASFQHKHFPKSLNAVWLLSLIFPSMSVTGYCWDTHHPSMLQHTLIRKPFLCQIPVYICSFMSE